MKIKSRIIIFCLSLSCLSYIAYSQTYSGCPNCVTNVPVMGGNGPRSNTDRRRIINLRIDETWGTNTPASVWNATCAGQPGAGCSNATGPSAINMWNSVGTYYFFQLYQSGSTDIQITRDTTWNQNNGCSYTSTPIEDPQTGASPSTSLRVIHLPPGSENWSQQQLACVLAHEIGHAIGLPDVYNEPGCEASIMNQGNSNTCSQGCVRTQIGSSDVQAANQQAGDRAHCGVTVKTPTANFNPGGGMTDPYPYRYNPTCYFYYDAVDYYRYCECGVSTCQCSSDESIGVEYIGTAYYLTDYFCY
jgi:hypothetical protein